jgi:glutamyl-Q tRNA(Asp) synthetase
MRVMISRFAPAPTGFLHLGHVVNAIYVWGTTRALAAAARPPATPMVLLRIEDHDRQRSRSEFDAEILDDLTWLGFAWDGPVVRQSARGDIYRQAVDRLREHGLIYACDCSRAEISVRAGRAGRAGWAGRGDHGESELWYPGTCRDRGLPEASGLGLRVRLGPSVERFVDLRHGTQEQRPSEQCGDLLVRDRQGNWTYQFAATVDDCVQGVRLVIRGDDLLASTGRQMQLARLLGRTEPPQFLHHPLIMKSPTQKLSKSDRDTGIRDLRAGGWTAERIIGHAAALAGLCEHDSHVRASDVVHLFG